LVESKVELKHRRVVTDAGPLIAFARMNLLVLLPEMFGTLIVPEAVLNECLHVPTRPDAMLIQQAVDAGLLDIHLDQTVNTEDWAPALGAGERAAICLAQALDCPVLLDDRLARRVATSVKLKLIGTAGMLVKAKQQKRIKAVAPLLHTLQISGYHLAPELLEHILRLAGEQK